MTGMADLIAKGIDIAVLALFGSLVWQNLTTKMGKFDDETLVNIRIVAKYFLYSLILLITAYVFDFARDQTWITVFYDEGFLLFFEEILLLIGYVMFIPPLYGLSKVLRDPRKAIGDVVLPDVGQVIFAVLVFLMYATVVYIQLTAPVTKISEILGTAFVCGCLGILLSFKRIEDWKRHVIRVLIVGPLFVFVGILVLRGLGRI